MKFIHLGDLHIGKTLHQQSLLDLQKEVLESILDYSNKENINVFVLAGDIYDRSVPSSEAVELLDDFLSTAIHQYNKKILMISGNHDSSERLNFVSGILKKQGLHIVSLPQKQLEPIEIEGVNFYLVPFFKPSGIRNLYGCDCTTYQDAFKYYLDQQSIDKTKPSVLVTHQFIAGNSGNVERSSSESILSVGGSEIIDVSCVEGFDYVALGHIHSSQKIKKETIRYSGSLLKYHFDEYKQKKGFVVVDIQGDDVKVEVIPTKVSKDVCVYKGLYKNLVNDKSIKRDDYIKFELEDINIIPHAIDGFRTRFPNTLMVTYQELEKEYDENVVTRASEDFAKKNPMELYEEFYEVMKNEKLDEQSREVMIEIIEGVFVDETD